MISSTPLDSPTDIHNLMPTLMHSPLLILDDSMKGNVNAYQHLTQLLLYLAKANDYDAFKEILYSPNLISLNLNDPLDVINSKMDVTDLLDVAKVILNPSNGDPSRIDFCYYYDKRIVDTMAEFVLSCLKSMEYSSHKSNDLIQLSRFILNYYLSLGNAQHIEYLKAKYFSKGPFKLHLSTISLIRGLNIGNLEELKVISMSDQNFDNLAYYAFLLGDLEKIEFVLSLHVKFNPKIMYMFLLIHKHYDMVKIISTWIERIQVDEHTQIWINNIIQSNFEAERIQKFLMEFSSEEIQILILSATSFMDHITTLYVFSNTNHYRIARATAIAGSSITSDFEMIQYYFSKPAIQPLIENGITLQLGLDAKNVMEVAILSPCIPVLHYLDMKKWITKESVDSGIKVALNLGYLEVIQFFLNRLNSHVKAKSILETYLSSTQVQSHSLTIMTYLIDKMHQDHILPFTKDMQDNIVDKLLSKDVRYLQYFTHNYYTKNLITSVHLIQIVEYAIKNNRLDLIMYLQSQPDLIQMLPIDKIELLNDKSPTLFNLNQLEEIYSSPSFDVQLGKKVIRSLHSKDILETVLMKKNLPTSFDIFCFQQIATVMIEFATNNEYELFDMILHRKDLVDWESKDMTKPIQYSVSILRPYDIFEIAKTVFKSPLPHSKVFNDVDDRIKASLSRFYMDNLKNIEILDLVLIELWTDYLSFYGKASDLDKFYSHLELLNLSASGYQNDRGLSYVLNHKDANTLSVMIQHDSIKGASYVLARLHSCFKGNVDAYRTLLQHSEYLIANKHFIIELEMALVLFHQHYHMRDLINHDENIENEDEWLSRSIQTNPISYLSHVLPLFDYEFLEYILPKITTYLKEDGLAEIATEIGILGDPQLLEMMYKYVPELNRDNTPFVDPIIHQASSHGHSALLKSVKQLHHKRLQAFACVFPALIKGNLDIVKVFMNTFPNQFTPNYVITNMFYLKGKAPSHILLSTILDQNEIDFENVMSLISHKTENDIQSLQYAAHNYYFSRKIDPQFVNHLLQFCKKNQIGFLLEYILSERNLFMKFNAESWNEYESSQDMKDSLFKSIFKKRGPAMYRSFKQSMHQNSLRIIQK